MTREQVGQEGCEDPFTHLTRSVVRAPFSHDRLCMS